MAASRVQALSWYTTDGHGTSPDLKAKVSSGAAGEIAATAARLMFGETPKLPVGGADAGLSDTDAKAAESRVVTLMEDGGGWAALHTGAEVQSATGGAYVLANWDASVLDHPFVQTVPAHLGVGDFRYGRCVAVTVWREVCTENGVTFRHLTRHENPQAVLDGNGRRVGTTPGVILNGLYAGTSDSLGSLHPAGLDGHPSTAGIPDTIIVPGNVRTAWYVPNKLPNKADLTSPEGAADWAGHEDLLAALDTAWHSWVRDIRLGKRQIIVPRTALGGNMTPGEGASWDPDTREVLLDLDLDPLGEGKDVVRPIDLAIRAADHETTLNALTRQLVSVCGYSPQTFGIDLNGQAESGTALRVKEGATIATVGSKRRYWSEVVTELAETLLTIDAEVFGSVVPVARPAIVWPPVRADSMLERAQTILALAQAEAASVARRVDMAFPELSAEDRATIVAEILAERPAAPADPFAVVEPVADMVDSAAADGEQVEG